MPYSNYTHTTLADFETMLLARLGDSGLYWPATEIEYYIDEALRTWGLLTGYWRDTGTFNTVSGTAFYNISTLTNSDGTSILSSAVTDLTIYNSIMLHLLEPTNATLTYTGSEQFTQADVIGAIQRRRDALLIETGATITRFTQNLPVGDMTVDLPDTTLKIRRMSWKGAVSGDDWVLYPEDIGSQRNYSPSFLTTQGIPETYSSSSVSPLRYVIAPPAGEAGTLDILAVQSGAALGTNPAGTVLGVPDDMSWIIKWGALADVLGKEGPGQDLPRSYFCERRWKLGIALANIYPTVINVEINGESLSPESISGIDQYMLNWVTDTGVPSFIGSLRNYIAVATCPNGVYSIVLDVTRKAPIPVIIGTNLYVQVGREYLDVLLDYCVHLASFKSGGQEFRHTFRAADNFFNAALAYNQRLAAQHPAIVELIRQSTKDDYVQPRQIPYSNPALEAAARPGDDVSANA